MSFAHCHRGGQSCSSLPKPVRVPPHPGPGWERGGGSIVAEQLHWLPKSSPRPLGDAQTENFSFGSYGNGEGDVAQKRKTSKRTIQNCLWTPQAFPQVDTQPSTRKPSRPGSVQMYCTRNKEDGVGYLAWQRKSWPGSHYTSVTQH